MESELKCKIEGCNRTDIHNKKLGLCSIHYHKNYRKMHKAELKVKNQKRYLEHRERNLAQSKAWIKKQPASYHTEKSRKYNTKNNGEGRRLNNIRNMTQNYFGHLRDSGVCQDCGKKAKVEFHHLEPYAYDNFVIVCYHCHRKRHGWLLVEIDEQGNKKILPTKPIKKQSEQ